MSAARSQNACSEPVYCNPKDMLARKVKAEPVEAGDSKAAPVAAAVAPVACNVLTQETNINEKLDLLLKSGCFQSIVSQARGDEKEDREDSELDRLLQLELEIQRKEEDLPKLRGHVALLTEQISKQLKSVSKKMESVEGISKAIAATERESQCLREERDALVASLSSRRRVSLTSQNCQSSSDRHAPQPHS